MLCLQFFLKNLFKLIDSNQKVRVRVCCSPHIAAVRHDAKHGLLRILERETATRAQRNSGQACPWNAHAQELKIDQSTRKYPGNPITPKHPVDQITREYLAVVVASRK